MSGQIVDIGHAIVYTRQVRACVDFYRKQLGLRLVIVGDVFNAFRVGTVHFSVMLGDPNPAVTFDFTSDDVHALQQRLRHTGIECSEVEHHVESGHDLFSFVDPDGRRMTVWSHHYVRHPDNCEVAVYKDADKLFLEAAASIRGSAD